MYRYPGDYLLMGDIFVSVPVPRVTERGGAVAENSAALLVSADCAICKKERDGVMLNFAPIYLVSGIGDPSVQRLVASHAPEASPRHTLYLPAHALLDSGDCYADLSQLFTLPLRLFSVESVETHFDGTEHRWKPTSNLGVTARAASLDDEGRARLVDKIGLYFRLDQDPFRD